MLIREPNELCALLKRTVHSGLTYRMHWCYENGTSVCLHITTNRESILLLTANRTPWLGDRLSAMHNIIMPMLIGAQDDVLCSGVSVCPR
jgi:hypothetical protein